MAKATQRAASALAKADINGQRILLCLPYRLWSHKFSCFLVVLITLVAFLGTAFPQQESQPKSSVIATKAPMPFDIVSIRPSDPTTSGFSTRPDPNNLRFQGVTLKDLIATAYGLHYFQIDGGPRWIGTARFDIQAKMDTDTPLQPVPTTMVEKLNLVNVRLRYMLENRFQLRFHKMTKQMPVFDLVVAKGGQKLKKSSVNEGYSAGPGHLRFSDATMEDLASTLSSFLERIVFNKTDLTDDYSFTLNWSPDDVHKADNAPPGIFTAVKEQLGLRLIPARGTVEVLSIDYAAMPSAN